MAQIDPALQHTLHWEGGYQKDPDDPGNYNSLDQLVGTNYGIAAFTAEDFLGFPPTEVLMRNLSIGLATCIYRQRFWARIKGDQIDNQAVANIFFDGHVNHGNTGIRIMQDVLGVKRDAIVGPITLGRLNASDPEQVYIAYRHARKLFYYKIVANRPHMKKFLRGWLNRIDSFTDY
jgi:lysozyme family protein